MSLNCDTGKYELMAHDEGVYRASWAVFWLSDALWNELRGDLDLLPEYVTTANEQAIKALESRGWLDQWSAGARSIVDSVSMILDK